MRFRLTGSLSSTFLSVDQPGVVVPLPYNTLLKGTAVAVGLAPATTVQALAGLGIPHLCYFRNSSATGQNIRVAIGSDPSFTGGAEAGILLEPKEGIVIEAISGMTVKAVADAAGGLLDVQIYQIII